MSGWRTTVVGGRWDVQSAVPSAQELATRANGTNEQELATKGRCAELARSCGSPDGANGTGPRRYRSLDPSDRLMSLLDPADRLMGPTV